MTAWTKPSRNIQTAQIKTGARAMELIHQQLYWTGPDHEWTPDTLDAIAAVVSCYFGEDN